MNSPLSVRVTVLDAWDAIALELARKLARQKQVSQGEAVSELVRRGARLPVPTTM